MYISPVSESKASKVAFIYSDDDRLLHVCIKLNHPATKAYFYAHELRSTKREDPSKMVMTLLRSEKMSPKTAITARWVEIFPTIHEYDRLAANLIQHLNPLVVIVS